VILQTWGCGKERALSDGSARLNVGSGFCSGFRPDTVCEILPDSIKPVKYETEEKLA